MRDCPGKFRPNVPTDNKSETCPDALGPDMDFGNAPILRNLPNGRTLIVVGQKDGHAWALDPDKQGAIVWSPQLGLGHRQWRWRDAVGLGGEDDRQGYFPVTRGGPTLGVAALQLATGELAWRASPPEGGGAPRDCDSGRGVLWIERRNRLRVFDEDGKAVWQFDTKREFETVNGVRRKAETSTARGPASPAGCCSCHPATRIWAAACEEMSSWRSACSECRGAPSRVSGARNLRAVSCRGEPHVAMLFEVGDQLLDAATRCGPRNPRIHCHLEHPMFLVRLIELGAPRFQHLIWAVRIPPPVGAPES